MKTATPADTAKKPEMPPKKPDTSADDDLLDGDDNWSVPSFLRRKK
jgi:hypothetical protein